MLIRIFYSTVAGVIGLAVNHCRFQFVPVCLQAVGSWGIYRWAGRQHFTFLNPLQNSLRPRRRRGQCAGGGLETAA